MITKNTLWIFSVGAPHVSYTRRHHNAGIYKYNYYMQLAQLLMHHLENIINSLFLYIYRWRTEVLLCIFLDSLATTC
jgi:hypothetical protein